MSALYFVAGFFTAFMLLATAVRRDRAPVAGMRCLFCGSRELCAATAVFGKWISCRRCGCSGPIGHKNIDSARQEWEALRLRAFPEG